VKYDPEFTFQEWVRKVTIALREFSVIKKKKKKTQKKLHHNTIKEITSIRQWQKPLGFCPPMID